MASFSLIGLLHKFLIGFPSIFRVASNPNSLISGLWDHLNHSWKITLRRNLKYDKIMHFSDLILPLEEVHISFRDNKKCIVALPYGFLSQIPN